MVWFENYYDSFRKIERNESLILLNQIFYPKLSKFYQKKHFSKKLSLKRDMKKIASHSETISFSITLPCFIFSTNVRKDSIDHIGTTEEIMANYYQGQSHLPWENFVLDNKYLLYQLHSVYNQINLLKVFKSNRIIYLLTQN